MSWRRRSTVSARFNSDLGRLLADGEVLKDSGAVETDRQEAIVDGLPPTTADILSRMRDDPTTDPFRNDLERETLRAEMEELVGEEGTPDLAIGDETTLDEHVEDRLDRLYAAKAYLQSERRTGEQCGDGACPRRNCQ